MLSTIVHGKIVPTYCYPSFLGSFPSEPKRECVGTPPVLVRGPDHLIAYIGEQNENRI
jgi:hypothetical protein